MGQLIRLFRHLGHRVALPRLIGRPLVGYPLGSQVGFKPPPSPMDYGEQELDFNAVQDRPLKRFRPIKHSDDGLRPYTPNSVPNGMLPEPEASGDQQAKKGGRKRPLSCGECRRCVGVGGGSTLTQCVSWPPQAQTQGEQPDVAHNAPADLVHSVIECSPATHVARGGAQKYVQTAH